MSTLVEGKVPVPMSATGANPTVQPVMPLVPPASATTTVVHEDKDPNEEVDDDEDEDVSSPPSSKSGPLIRWLTLCSNSPGRAMSRMSTARAFPRLRERTG